MIKHPPKLSQGSRIALVAPAFSFDPTLMKRGRNYLESKYGVKTLLLESVYEKDLYFAGNDERRTEELYHWITNPDIDAILAIRGGYGTSRIYSNLLEKLKSDTNTLKVLKPKIVGGYSDLTLLINGLHQDLNWVTFHTPVLTGKPLHEPNRLEEQTFHDALFTSNPLGSISYAKMQPFSEGNCKAPLVGGCLSMILSSLGTSYEIQMDGKILFIEDVDESPFRIDRMLIQLLHAGKLDKIKGIVFGQMHHCSPSKKNPDVTTLHAIHSALDDFLKKNPIPVVYDFPAGHGDPQITFPIGCLVELKVTSEKAEVIFLESGTS